MHRSPLFSLPVHERPDVVADQLTNIRRFCPEAIVCVHVSRSYDGDMAPFSALARTPGVLLNPRRFEVLRGRGLFHVHVANFMHARAAHPEIGRICLISSNELLVRAGVSDYLGAHDAGAQFEMFDPATDWQVFRKRPDTLPEIAALLRLLDLPVIFGGQSEGQFYDSDLFFEIAQVFLRFLPLAPSQFETDEVLPQTIALRFLGPANRIGLPFTLQNYCNRFDITPEVIATIRAGRGWVFGPRMPGTLPSPHVGLHDLSSVFAVKRVPRESCALRSLIAELPASEPVARAA